MKTAFKDHSDENGKEAISEDNDWWVRGRMIIFPARRLAINGHGVGKVIAAEDGSTKVQMIGDDQFIHYVGVNADRFMEALRISHRN